MHFAAGEQDYEQAAIERNRLQAVRALLERQRVADQGAGSFDAVAIAVDGTEANAQVFQVRDGVLSDRQSFYLDNQGEHAVARACEEFLLQYYSSRNSSHARATACSPWLRSEEHTSELQSHVNLVCRLLLEKKKKQPID